MKQVITFFFDAQEPLTWGRPHEGIHPLKLPGWDVPSQEETLPTKRQFFVNGLSLWLPPQRVWKHDSPSEDIQTEIQTQ